MPPVTQALLIVNVLVFFVVQQLGPTIIVQFGLWPWATELFRPWQVVSYAFLHGSLTHLAFNMFGLWMFGSELERVWGTRRMLQFYFASVLVAAAAQLIVTGVMGSQAPTVGASGGAMGLLGALLVVLWRHPALQGTATGDAGRRFAVSVVVVQALFDGVMAEVSFAGHAAGLASGALIALAWVSALRQLSTPGSGGDAVSPKRGTSAPMA